jgi:hypothetical protein
VLKAIGWVLLAVASVAGILSARMRMILRDSDYRARSKTRFDTWLLAWEEDTYNMKGRRLMNRAFALFWISYIGGLLGLVLVLSDGLRITW